MWAMEMIFTPAVATPAVNGSVAGFKATCKCCGLVVSSSLATMFTADQAAHAAYHDRQKGRS